MASCGNVARHRNTQEGAACCQQVDVALAAERRAVAKRLYFTAGCTTGWVNYANEPSQAAPELANQDVYDAIRLTRSKAAMRTVDDVARLIEI